MTAANQQRHDALDHANAIRLGRAGIRRKLHARELTAAQVLADPPASVLSWPVGDMLSCQWRWGDKRTRTFLGLAGVSWHREIRMLTERQIKALVQQLEAS
jgi:hypothetical protein